jgi:predicted N-acetyltransferase YhbS
MIIRKALVSDAEAAFALIKEDKADSFSSEDFRRAAIHDDAIFLVAEENRIIGYVIGFICPTKKADCMLAETRVIAEYRKKGIGMRLVEEFCKEAFRKDATNIFAEVDAKDAEFYSKNGFRKSTEWIELVRTK